VAQIFNLSQSFNDGNSVTPEYTCKPGDSIIEGVVSAGPMGNSATHVNAFIQLNRNDGNGWVDVGGLSSQGGMMSTTKGGPLTTPVTASGNTYCNVQQGWKLRGSISVVNGPVTVSFAGNIT
jgi:hypothetical protein